MKRRRLLITGVLLLLGGAIVNVAVAWTIAYPTMPFGWSRNGSHLDYVGQENPILTSVHVSQARIRVTQEYKDFPGLYLALDRVPATPEWFRIAPGAVDQRLGQSIDGKTIRRIEEGAVGWPMFSLKYWRAVSGNWAGYETLAAHGAIVISHHNGVIKYDRLLPFSPVLPGFAINTIFYAASLWGMFFVPGMVRRRIRRRRGLCPACAYPTWGGGTSPVCTECGKAVRRDAISLGEQK